MMIIILSLSSLDDETIIKATQDDSILSLGEFKLKFYLLNFVGLFVAIME